MKNTRQRNASKSQRGRYLVVGIDPHKKKHAAVAMTQDFTTHSKFKFNNSREGFEIALGRLRREMVKAGCRQRFRVYQWSPAGTLKSRRGGLARATSEYTRGQRTNKKVKPDAEA